MRDFFKIISTVVQPPLIDGKTVHKSATKKKAVHEITALPIRSNDVTLISTNKQFVEDYCKVHSLADYRREYFKTALVPLQVAGMDFLLFDIDDIGPTIADK